MVGQDVMTQRMSSVVSLTNICNNAGEYDLPLPACLDGGAEIGVVPGVDLPLTLDQRGIGVHGENLLREGAVGTFGQREPCQPSCVLSGNERATLFSGTSHDHGQIEQFSESGMG